MPIKFNNNADGSLDIEIYDVIGLWGMNVATFSARLKALKGKPVNLRINSPGGSITEGFAIMSVLRRHDGMVTAYIDGVAASMAGVVAMAAKRIVMPKNSFIMIHDPSATMQGTSEELRKAADVLDKMGEMLISAYTRDGKVNRDVVAEMITGESSTNEHWLTADECLALGLCDEVVQEVAAAALAKHADYFENFAAKAVKNPPAMSAGGQAQQPNQNMKTIMTALGLNASASEEDGAQKATEIKNRVATLEREAKDKEKAHADSLIEAKNAALQQATSTENKRKADLKAFAAKYDKDGDLNSALVDALAGTTTVEQFKDIVLDIVNTRPAKGAIRPQGKGDAASGEDEEVEVTDIASFKKAYAACKDDVARRQLVRQHRRLSRQALRVA